VTLDQFYTLVAGVSPVTVHDEGYVVRDGACFEHTEEDTSDTIDGIVAKPECALQKRHYWVLFTAIDRVLFLLRPRVATRLYRC